MPAEQLIASSSSSRSFKTIGKSVVKVDGLEKSDGRSIYAADLSFPGMIHAALVRSIHPHARIISFNASKALGRKGVLAVLTADDIEGVNAFGKNLTDQPILSKDTIDYFGQPIAVIAAETAEIAKKAIQDVVVDYQVLPPVLTLEEARTNADKSYLIQQVEIREGDLESGFSMCSEIVEESFRTQRTDPLFLEPPAGVAEVDNTGVVTIYAACQYPYGMRRQVAAALGLPISSIRIIQTECGGGFGGKVEASVHIYIALVAQKLGRPVKLVMDRAETFLTAVKRHPMVLHYKAGATSDGKLRAMGIEIVSDTGAFETSGIPVLRVACQAATGPYHVPNLLINGWAYRTHHVPSGAQRGFGVPQVAFAHEAIMDELARRLGLSPAAFRERNLLENGSRLPGGQILEGEVPTREVLAALADGTPAIDPVSPGYIRGTGMALCFKSVGYSGGDENIARVRLELLQDGSVLMSLGCIDMGQGAYTTLSQLLAEELDIDISRIQIAPIDTNDELDSCSTEGSRATIIVGQAVMAGAREFRCRLVQEAALILKLSPELLSWQGGCIQIKDSSSRLSLPILAKRRGAASGCIRVEGSSKQPKPGDLLADGVSKLSAVDLSYVGATADVEIDPRSGDLKIRALKLVQDVGFAIHPINVRVQVESGAVMGLGFATSEEFLYESGIPASLKLSKYKLPRCKDVPPIESVLIEKPGEIGPYGAKGIGELPTIPVAAAIANALYDAVGLRVTELPMTKKKLQRVLNGNDSTNEGQSLVCNE